MAVSEVAIVKALIQSDGNQSLASRKLGINQSGMNQRLQRNPHIKEAVLTAKAKALAEAGLTRPKIYKVLAKGLKANVVSSFEGNAIESNAPDYKERREAAKLAAQLIGDLDGEKVQVNNFNLSNDERIALQSRLKAMNEQSMV